MGNMLKLGYFLVMKEASSYLGGLLVTDPTGIPMDFRYTEPITPTKLQNILYGKALEPHLKEEVIQRTLLREMKTPPDVFIIPVSDLTGGWTGEGKVPVLALQRSQEAPLASLGQSFRVSQREVLIQLTEGAAPIRVLFAPNVELSSQEACLSKLFEAGYQMDLLEPMERVSLALQSLVRGES